LIAHAIHLSIWKQKGLYTAWAAVIGVLKLQFAKTIALGIAM